MTDAEKLVNLILTDTLWFAQRLLEKYTYEQILTAYNNKQKQDEIASLEAQILQARARLAELGA